MLPIAALIGALLALGNLARSMELIVMRAAGVSVARIAMWVAGAGVHPDGAHRRARRAASRRRWSSTAGSMKTFEKFQRLQPGGQSQRVGEGRRHDHLGRPAVGRQPLRRRVRLQLRRAASAAQRRAREQREHRREQRLAPRELSRVAHRGGARRADAGRRGAAAHAAVAGVPRSRRARSGLAAGRAACSATFVT